MYIPNYVRCMAITKLGQTAQSLLPTQGSDDDNKLIVREYGKTNPSIYSESFQVLTGRISKSGKWIILETDKFVVLYPVGNKAIQELYNVILPALNGKSGNALVIEPNKKDKFGGTIGVDDSYQVWYEFNETTLEFETSIEAPTKKSKGQAVLSLEMFTSTNAKQDSNEVDTQVPETSNSTTATNISTKSKTKATKTNSQEAGN